MCHRLNTARPYPKPLTGAAPYLLPTLDLSDPRREQCTLLWWEWASFCQGFSEVELRREILWLD